MLDFFHYLDLRLNGFKIVGICKKFLIDYFYSCRRIIDYASTFINVSVGTSAEKIIHGNDVFIDSFLAFTEGSIFYIVH